MVDTSEIQTMISDYFAKLYANKLGNSEKMGRFLDAYEFLKLAKEEIKP